MTSKLARVLITALFTLPALAVAQSGGADALPAAPSAANTAASSGGATATGNKIGTINIEQAIYGSNEGQRDFEALSKKLEPKQTELKNLNDEVDSLKKQLNTQSDKLTDDARANLLKQTEQKQKALERAVQDARDDAQNQQNEIAQRILQKMAPLIVKFAGDNAFGVILDTSNPWPQGPVLWAGPSVDITKSIVDTYNLQSGVPPPAKPAAARPAAAKPAAAKPAATGATGKPAAPATKPASAPAK